MPIENSMKFIMPNYISRTHYGQNKKVLDSMKKFADWTKKLRLYFKFSRLGKEIKSFSGMEKQIQNNK